MSLLAKRSMAAGEITPALYARTDTVKYALGLRTLRNAIVKRFGGTESRSGSKKLGLTKTQAAPIGGIMPTRKIEFQFDNNQGYIIELGDLYARFFRNDRPVVEDNHQVEVVDGHSGATPLEIELSITPPLYTSGDRIYIGGINHIIPDGEYLVDVVTGDRFTITDLLGNDIFWDGGEYENPAPSGSYVGPIFEVVTPYLDSELSEVRYVQSGDIVVLTHQAHPVQRLTRTGTDDTDWTWANATFGPSINPPTGLNLAGTGSGLIHSVALTSVSAAGEESLVSAQAINGDSIGTFTLTWTPPAQPVSYYKMYTYGSGSWDGYGVMAYISGAATTFTFTIDAAGPIFLEPDVFPPSAVRNPFNTSNTYPKCCGIYNQRLFLGNFPVNSEGIEGSRVGSLFNFQLSFPAQDNEGVSFTVAGRQVNPIQHLLDLALLLIFSESSEILVNTSAITPSNIPLETQSYNGSSALRPLLVDDTAIYADGANQAIRDPRYTFETDGYRGNDLLLFSAHLLEGYSIRAWAFQKSPDPVLWIVRDDGTLLSLTYVREQAIVGWARHDMDDAVVEDVQTLKNGLEVGVYLTVSRTIDGANVRTIEKFTPRFIRNDAALVDFIAMDAAVSFDGRVDPTLDASQVKITGGTSWNEYDGDIIVESTGTETVFFGDVDVGNELHFPTSDGGLLILEILSVAADLQSATVRPNRTVPVDMRDVVLNDWARAMKVVRGLAHLEGREVSVMQDGWVSSSPYNNQVLTVTVTDGEVTLPRAGAVIHVGTPFLVDIETLDVDFSGGTSIADKKKKVNEVTLQLQKTRGIFVGPRPPANDANDALQDLLSLKIRDLEGYNQPISLYTGKESVVILPEWNSNGRVFIRQVDPLPCSVLAVFPNGDYPVGNGG